MVMKGGHLEPLHSSQSTCSYLMGCCLLHFKGAWAAAFTVDAPHLEEHLLQILDPGCGVKEGAGEPSLLQALTQMQALCMIQAQLDSAVLHALPKCHRLRQQE